MAFLDSKQSVEFLQSLGIRTSNVRGWCIRAEAGRVVELNVSMILQREDLEKLRALVANREPQLQQLVVDHEGGTSIGGGPITYPTEAQYWFGDGVTEKKEF